MKISFVFAVTSQKDRWTFLEDQDCVDYYNHLNNETLKRYQRSDQITIKRFVDENPFINNVLELIDLIKNKPDFAQLTFSQYTGMFSNNVIINGRKSKHSKSSEQWGTFIKQQSDVISNRQSLSYSSPPNSSFFISHMDCTNHYIHIWNEQAERIICTDFS